MKFATLTMIVAASLLGACTRQAPPEKGGPVTAHDYVDLIPPTNYSPVRGVLCESLSVDADNYL